MKYWLYFDVHNMVLLIIITNWIYMKLQDKDIHLKVPNELLELMKSQEVRYQSKMVDILLSHYGLSLISIKQSREAANNEK